MKEKAKYILENSKLFNISIQVLILASIAQLSLESMPDFKREYSDLLQLSEIFFIIIFFLEYLFRLYLAEEKLRFVFSFYGFIDLVAILPSILLFHFFDFRFIRLLRFLRVFRILKLARYSRALNRVKGSFYNIREELTIFLILSIVLIYISASGIYYFEHEAQPEIFKSIPHSLWWSVATLTTVGYGDIYPVTVGGKIFTFFMLIIGIGIISVPSGLFASSFSKNSE